MKTKTIVPVKYAILKLYKSGDTNHFDMYKCRLQDMTKDSQASLDIHRKDISMLVVKNGWKKLILM